MKRTSISALQIFVCRRPKRIINQNEYGFCRLRRTNGVKDRSKKIQKHEKEEIIILNKKKAETSISIQSCGHKNRRLLSPINIEIEKFPARLNSHIRKYNTIYSLYRIKPLIVNLNRTMRHKSLSSIQMALGVLAGDAYGF